MGQKQTGTKFYRVEFKEDSNPEILNAQLENKQLKSVFKS